MLKESDETVKFGYFFRCADPSILTYILNAAII